MYTPRYARIDDPEWIRLVIEQKGLATVVTYDEDGFAATHVPLLYRREDGADWLEGHVSKANSHWRHFEGHPDALVIFQGPDHYVSPRWYDHMNVPTWNYVAVHAYGEVSLIENPEEIRRQLDAMVRRYEPSGEYRLESLTEEYYQKEIRALKCFKIRVNRFEASFKLSQNRDAKNYSQVIDALEREGNDSAKAIAEWMKKMYRKDAE